MRPRRAAVLATLAAAAMLVAAGCGPGSHSKAAAGNFQAKGTLGGVANVRATVRWRACFSGSTTRCGRINVPLNYANPGGRKVTLALTEVPATAPPSRRQGILLVNPGGPGASGTSLAEFVAQGLNRAVAARFDIIGFDTRGVGASVPALHCEPSFFSRARPNYIPANAAAERVLIGRAKAYAADCEKRFGWLLPYMTTQNVARDMDLIRAALGQQKLSYLAYSYGTYIGQVYATMFPHRVHRMVLDSTIDPTGVWYQDNIEQDYAFQGRMNAFLAWMAKYNTLYHLGATPAQVSQSWYAARARLAANPVLGPSGSPLIGADEYDDTMLMGAYDNEFWPALAAGLANYLHGGSTQELRALYSQIGTQSENEFAVYNAVECADVAWPRNWAKWNADARRVYARVPVETWDNVWFNASCAFWPVHGPAKPMRIGAPGLPGILMLQGTLDGATPYAGAQNAHRALPTARMVVVVGGGNHGQSLDSPPDTCVNDYLNSYLATGALPSAPGLVNATCPAVPDPIPSG